MLSHRQQQVERLYFAAKERNAAERGRFLQEMCAGDAGLRQEVESRLQQDVVLPVFCDSPETLAYVPERSRSTNVPSLAPGTRIGVYEVVMLLGAGGMGQVYKARDTRLGRPVAIKVLSETLGQKRSGPPPHRAGSKSHFTSEPPAHLHAVPTSAITRRSTIW